jgi:hypothetical protein
MASLTQLSLSDIARRGETLYEQALKQQVEPQHVGEFLVVDVETGDYEIGTDYILPTEHLLAKRPDAPLYALRIGYRSIGRIGGRYTPARR